MHDFEIGIITKAQGIRGEFRVLPTTDDISRFERLVGDAVKINSREYEVTAARLQKNIVVLKFDGIDDRNAAEKLIGAVICVPREKALPLGDNEFFIRDLLGLNAVEENGEKIGVIERVFHTGANDVYVVKTLDGGAFMIPAIKDIVKKIDLGSGEIFLRLPEGIRELTI